MSKKKSKLKSGSSKSGASKKSHAATPQARSTDAESLDPLASGFTVLGLLAFLAMAILTLLQGGYYAGTVSACGVIFGVVALVSYLVRRRTLSHLPLMPLLLFVLACCYALSAVVNGLTLAAISATSFWFSVAAFSLVCSLLETSAKEAVVRWFCWFGVCCAVAGFFMFTQVIPLEGTLNAGRLQFSFQYANAAGIWFAVVAALCVAASDARLRAAALLPLMALLLTQSTGAIALFVVAAVALMWWQRAEEGRLATFVIQVLSALVLFVAMRLVPGAVGLVFPALAIALCYALWRYRAALRSLNARAVGIGGAIVAAVAVLVVVLLQGNRLGEASQTFVERFIQVLDAAGLLAMSPLIGIGPDVWRSVYPFEQSAQYTASVIHCGYAQIALDAGLVGLVVFCVALMVGVRGLIKQRKVAWLIAGALILVHGLVDFDFRFGALVFLLVFLLSKNTGIRCGQVPALVVGVVLSVLVACACVAGLWAENSRDRLAVAAAAGNAEAVERVMSASGPAVSNAETTTYYLEALLRGGDADSAIAWYRQNGVASGEQALLVAQAFFANGESAQAGRVLIDELMREPYQTSLYKQAEALFNEYGLDDAVRGDYQKALDRANSLAKEGHAAWLNNQEEMTSSLVS